MARSRLASQNAVGTYERALEFGSGCGSPSRAPQIFGGPERAAINAAATGSNRLTNRFGTG
jgi:hypothetical protein